MLISTSKFRSMISMAKSFMDKRDQIKVLYSGFSFMFHVFYGDLNFLFGNAIV